MWLIAFTIYIKGDYDLIVIIFAYITGLIGGGFLFDERVNVNYDELTNNWNGVYPSIFFIFIIPLIIIAFVRIIQPLTRRIQFLENNRDRNTLLLMIFGISLVLLWGITSGFTSNDTIRSIRPIFLTTGWFTWYLSSQRNPFFVSVSNVNPERILITNDDGHLYYSYSFHEDQKEVSAELVAPLVQALNNMILDVLNLPPE